MWVGQYGCKLPAESFLVDFAAGSLAEGSALDVGWQLKDPEHIYLFGACGGRFTLPNFANRKNCTGYIRPALPGLSSAGDPLIWGTLEVRLTGLGFAGSAKHKYMQGYTPLSHVLKAAGEYEMRQPQTMKSLRGRKQGLINLVDTVCSSLDKVGGC